MIAYLTYIYSNMTNENIFLNRVEHAPLNGTNVRIGISPDVILQ